MIKKSKSILWALSLILLSTTGCWDKVEIDSQQFVLAMGIDKNKNVDIKSNNVPERYQVTYVTPTLSKSEKDGGESANERFIQVITGETITGATKKSNTYYLEPLSYEHVKVIIIGQELAEDKELLKELLDYLNRDPEFSRTIPIFITPGTAEEVLNAEIEGPSLRSRWVIRNRDVTGIPDELIIDLGVILSEMGHHQGVTVIPKIEIEGKSYKVEGAALFSDYVFQDWLDPEEMRMITWLRGKNHRGSIPLFYKEVYVPYEVANLSCKIKSASYDDYLSIELEIETEGDITEYTLRPTQDKEGSKRIDENWIKEVEKELGKQVEKELSTALDKIQGDYKADIIHLDNHLKLRHPKIWKKVEDDYKEIFAEARIQVKVDLSIRRIGMTF